MDFLGPLQGVMLIVAVDVSKWSEVNFYDAENNQPLTVFVLCFAGMVATQSKWYLTMDCSSPKKNLLFI